MGTSFYLHTIDGPQVAHRRYGGDQIGVVVVDDETLPDETVIVSEYGEETTLGAVRQSRGAGRRAS